MPACKPTSPSRLLLCKSSSVMLSTTPMAAAVSRGIASSWLARAPSMRTHAGLTPMSLHAAAQRCGSRAVVRRLSVNSQGDRCSRDRLSRYLGQSGQHRKDAARFMNRGLHELSKPDPLGESHAVKDDEEQPVRQCAALARNGCTLFRLRGQVAQVRVNSPP